MRQDHERVDDQAQVGAVGRYKLESLLGSGATGKVYLAEYTASGGFSRKCALKLIPLADAEEEKFAPGVIGEARLGGYLNHRNIVQTLDLGIMNGNSYIAMEYVPGFTLQEAVRSLKQQNQRVPLALALTIGEEICRGLDYAHNATDNEGRALRMVHRDLKPSNILISYHGDVKIADFGVARAESNPEKTMLPGVVKGTLGYMSCEQAQGLQSIDHRSDLYSVGSLIFEILTGEPLYSHQAVLGLLALVQRGNFEERLAVVPAYDVRPALIDILTQALQRDRDRRFQSAQEMAQAIRALLQLLPYGSQLREFAVGLAPTIDAYRHHLHEASQSRKSGKPGSEIEKAEAKPGGSKYGGGAFEGMELPGSVEGVELESVSLTPHLSLNEVIRANPRQNPWDDKLAPASYSSTLPAAIKLHPENDVPGSKDFLYAFERNAEVDTDRVGMGVRKGLALPPGISNKPVYRKVPGSPSVQPDASKNLMLDVSEGEIPTLMRRRPGDVPSRNHNRKVTDSNLEVSVTPPISTPNFDVATHVLGRQSGSGANYADANEKTTISTNDQTQVFITPKRPEQRERTPSQNKLELQPAAPGRAVIPLTHEPRKSMVWIVIAVLLLGIGSGVGGALWYLSRPSQASRSSESPARLAGTHSATVAQTAQRAAVQGEGAVGSEREAPTAALGPNSAGGATATTVPFASSLAPEETLTPTVSQLPPKVTPGKKTGKKQGKSEETPRPDKATPAPPPSTDPTVELYLKAIPATDQVFLDNRKLDNPSQWKRMIPPGSHSIRFVDSSGKKLEEKFSVMDGGTVKCKVSFEEMNIRCSQE